MDILREYQRNFLVPFYFKNSKVFHFRLFHYHLIYMRPARAFMAPADECFNGFFSPFGFDIDTSVRLVLNKPGNTQLLCNFQGAVAEPDFLHPA